MIVLAAPIVILAAGITWAVVNITRATIIRCSSRTEPDPDAYARVIRAERKTRRELQSQYSREAEWELHPEYLANRVRLPAYDADAPPKYTAPDPHYNATYLPPPAYTQHASSEAETLVEQEGACASAALTSSVTLQQAEAPPPAYEELYQPKNKDD